MIILSVLEIQLGDRTMNRKTPGEANLESIHS